MNTSTNISFRVDRNLKKEADLLFKNLGMNTSVALNMFLTQCVRDQALPFKPKMIVNNSETKNTEEEK